MARGPGSSLTATSRPQAGAAGKIAVLKALDGYQIPLGQYALKLESTVPLVCQIGRMDVQQPNLAYYTVMGHPTD